MLANDGSHSISDRFVNNFQSQGATEGGWVRMGRLFDQEGVT